MSGSLLKQSLAAIEKLQARLDDLENAQREPIAIIGAACRYPGGAVDPEGLWRIVRDGRDVVGPLPPGRRHHADPATRGGFLPDIDLFDPLFFSISAREANAMDPQHRLLLETGYEALERAGLAVDRLAGSAAGVFVGITQTDYAQLMLAGPLDEADHYVASGGALNTAAGRLSFAFGFEGPSIAVDTACSSSLVAVHLAVQSLRARETSLALAAGVNIILRPILTKLFAGMGMMAADQLCKPFDAAADGFVRSEGCGMIVLKRLADAQAAGDPVMAVIRGSAVNAGGRSSGLSVPHGPSQAAVIRAALANAGLSAGDIDYVEAHGTGTSLGDPIEMEAVASVLAQQRSPGRELLVGALKSNIGNTEAASGIGGLLKTVLALQHQQIPPNLHFHSPSPKIAWGEIAVRVPTKLTAWPRGARPRRAGVSGFGFTGTNAHVILEEAPAGVAPQQAAPGSFLVPFSARNATALRALAARHAEFLATDPPVTLADYVVTMGQGRSQMRHRLGVIAGSTTALADALRQFATGTDGPGMGPAGVASGEARPGHRPKLAFMYTGEGARSPGMAQGLYQTEKLFRDAIDHCAALLAGRLDRPLTELLFASREAPPVARFAFEFALTELWRAWGVVPNIVVAHGLGECVAAFVAGLFSLEDALRRALGSGAEIAAAAPRLPLLTVETDAACFADCAASLRASGVTALLQIGPHPTLLNLAAQEAVDAGWAAIASLRPMRDPGAEIRSALQQLYLAGVNPVWQAAGGRRVALPVYPFQRTRYWMPTRRTSDPDLVSTADEMPPRAAGDFLMCEVARVLDVEREALDVDTPLSELGFDSMMAIQVRHAIARHFGIDLPLRALLAGPTLDSLAALLAAERPVETLVPATLGWEEGSL